MQRYLLWVSILYHPDFTLSMLYIHLAKNIHVLNSCGSPREAAVPEMRCGQLPEG